MYSLDRKDQWMRWTDGVEWGNQCTALSHLSKPNNEYPMVNYGYLLCILLAVLLMKILILGVYSLDRISG